MRFKSSDPKDNLGNGLITSLGFKAKSSPNKHKNVRYAIRNASKKYLSNIIREFYKLPYKSYERMRPKKEHTDS